MTAILKLVLATKNWWMMAVLNTLFLWYSFSSQNLLLLSALLLRFSNCKFVKGYLNLYSILYSQFLKSQSNTDKSVTENQIKQFRKREKKVLIVYLLVMLLLIAMYTTVLTYVIRMVIDKDNDTCSTKAFAVETGFYVFVILLGISVSLYLCRQLKNARDKFWQGYKHIFIMFMVCCTVSYLIKVVLNMTATLFTSSVYDGSSSNNSYMYISTVLYALAELAYIF